MSASTTVQVAPSSGVTRSVKNPLQIAILDWYDVNRTTTFPIPAFELAFDGAHMWVTHQNALSKVLASDGKVIATYSVSNPRSPVFDGANIWVTNFPGNIVTKFDGANIWVTHQLGVSLVTKLRASDGKVVANFTVSDPTGIAFDGANMWVANQIDNTVTKLRAISGRPTVASKKTSPNFPPSAGGIETQSDELEKPKPEDCLLNPAPSDDNIAIVKDGRLSRGNGTLRLVKCNQYFVSAGPFERSGRGLVTMADLHCYGHRFMKFVYCNKVDSVRSQILRVEILTGTNYHLPRITLDLKYVKR